MNLSPLQKARYEYAPKLPGMLRNGIAEICVKEGEDTQSVADQDKIKALFPNTYGKKEITFQKGQNTSAAKKQVVGVILSGGQAPGGHNVVCGLYDALKATNKDNVLFGFKGGPSGLLENDYVIFDDEYIDQYRNTGGFDIIGSGRTKLETEQQFGIVAEVAKKHGLTAIVIIGGDDSNTNAAVLAEYMAAHGTGVQVIGCPKTIDGDLKNAWIEVSFGFDTATKVYSELIGNIMRDANSARKYWHFIKLMGRSASHIALECALQTHPNACIISEEVQQKNISLNQIVWDLTNLVIKRASKKLNFGVVLVPEGLIEFVPELNPLIAELNDSMAEGTELGDQFNALPDMDAKIKFVEAHLKGDNLAVFKPLPTFVKAQLLGDRDPHGNVQVSKIETEKLLIAMVEANIKAYNGATGNNVKFSTQAHFFGYEGRCAAPSNFDADYCYALGYNASALIANDLTGYMSSVRNISKSADKWEAGGIPLTMMMNMEHRHGKDVPVIKKALVELDAKPFKTFAANRDKWAEEVDFVYPGPIQYFGPAEVCDRTTLTLQLERA